MDDLEHQWVILASYQFSEDELIDMMASEGKAVLSFDHVIAVLGPACFRCERTWHEAKGTPCPGGERLPKEGLHLVRSGRFEEIERDE